MKAKTFIYKYIIPLLGITLNLLYLFANKSICSSSSCHVLQAFTANSRILPILAIVAFLALIAVPYCLQKWPSFHLKAALTVLFIAIGIVEAYLVLVQVYLNEYCTFCLIITGLFCLAFLHYAVANWPLLFFVLVPVASFIFVSNIVSLKPFSLPSSQCTLVYSDQCPSCHSVLEFCKTTGKEFNLIELQKASVLCKTFGIDKVPALICFLPDSSIKVVKGEQNIRQWILTSQVNLQLPLFDDQSCNIYKSCDNNT